MNHSGRGDRTTEARSATLDQLLEALANPHRREIVYLLGLQPWGISQLAQNQGLSLPAIHKHLKILEDAGLIRRRKHGRTTYLTLIPQPLLLLQNWVGQFHPHWTSSEASYENYARHLGFDPPRRPTDPRPSTGEPE